MRAVLLAVALAALAVTSCSEVNPFYCDDSDQCYLDDVDGVCTEYNACAFPDTTCPGPEFLRYHPDSELGDVCVGEEED